MEGVCRICGALAQGQPFDKWVKPTFTDHDKLVDGIIICDACLFWFDERSVDLATRMDKEKPQRMRNYSHFVVEGKWEPLSKSNKRWMQRLLLGKPFPELAAIAESGQKHIVFRAIRNPPGAEAGWVQFEEQRLFIQPSELKHLLDVVENLYSSFSKTEIGTGNYKQHRIIKFGYKKWYILEVQIARERESLLFKLVLFLAQKGEENDTVARESGRSVRDNLAGSAGRLQEQVSEEYLAAVRG